MTNISVIIPAYRAAQTIGATVRSILQQTLRPAEILVVDDGSPDDIAGAVVPFGSEVTLIRQANAGVAEARNRGIAAARGEIIAFLDADDLWEPQKLQRQIDILQKYPTVGLVAGRYFNQEPGHAREIADMPAEFLDRTMKPTGAKLIELACQIWTGAVMVRREALEDIRFISEFEPAEDRDVWIRILRGHSAYMISEPLATAVLVPQSLSRRDPDYGYEPMLRVLEKHADLPNRSQMRKLQATVYRSWASAHLARGTPRGAVAPALGRLRRQPFSPQAWWIFAKASCLSMGKSNGVYQPAS
jgi:glycosyltransferase involved in cell wall biosynthesis